MANYWSRNTNSFLAQRCRAWFIWRRLCKFGGFMFKKTKLFNVPIHFGTLKKSICFLCGSKRRKHSKTRCVFINETIPYPIVLMLINYIKSIIPWFLRNTKSRQKGKSKSTVWMAFKKKME
jgi:hypothetical protein